MVPGLLGKGSWFDQDSDFGAMTETDQTSGQINHLSFRAATIKGRDDEQNVELVFAHFMTNWR